MIRRTVSHYHILEKLGEGGMGVVYRARDTQLERDVAVKFLPECALVDSESRVRFRREAKSAAQLVHPSIATVFDIGDTDDGQSYIVMELVEGETLAQRISRGPLSIEDVNHIGRQIADGLQVAHEKGVVHRDIKPSNIMLDPSGRARILDFGLATTTESTRVTRRSSTAGTVAYMSPEQAAGAKVDRRTDIWSLGVVLYEMIAGRVPFPGDYEQAVVYGILNTRPEPLTAIRTGVPVDLERIVNKCLEKDRSRRYQHVEEVGVDLALLEFGAGLPVAIVSPRGVRRALAGPMLQTKRRKRIAGIATLLALLGLIVSLPTLSRMWGATSTPIRSIAVIPRGCEEGLADEVYRCDLFAQTLMDALSQIAGLDVKSFQVVERYKNSEEGVLDIGKALDVDAVATATIQERGSGLRYAVEVTGIPSGAYIWADRGDVAEEFERLALTVADKLQLRLDSEERERMVVFNTYQRAIYYWNTRTAESLNHAIELFEEVIHEDPQFARAHAGLASTYVLLPYYGGTAPRESYPLARKAAEQALALDESLADAHAALGLVNRDYERNWLSAEQEFKRAIELDPHSALAHQWYAELLAAMGRFDEAQAAIMEAEALSPLSLNSRAVHGWILMCAGHSEEARFQLETTREMGPDHHLAVWFLGQLHVQRGDFRRAIELFTEAVELSQGNSRVIADLGSAFALAGDRSRAEEVLRQLDALSRSGAKISRYEYAVVYSGLGEIDRAIQEWETALDERTWQVVNSNVDPMLKPVRDDPRFDRLLLKLGLPSPQRATAWNPDR